MITNQKTFEQNYYKPSFKRPIDYKCLNIDMVLDELSEEDNTFFWKWFNRANNDDKINVIFPEKEIWEESYEFQKKQYEPYGMKAIKQKFIEKQAIFKLPRFYDGSNDKKNYDDRKKSFFSDMKDSFQKRKIPWTKETEKDFADNVDFGEQKFERINTILEKIYDKYPEHYDDDTIKCWHNYEDEPDIDFDYPVLDYEKKALYLSELIEWIKTFDMNTNGFYEWILRSQYIEGRYAWRVWQYDLDEKNFRKEKAPENILQINEMLKQLYKVDITQDGLAIYFDFHKDVDKKIFD